MRFVPKLDTFIIMSKGGAYLIGGFFGPWAAALGQWVIEGIYPPGIVWIGLLLPLSLIGATNAWLAFCSGSWKEYRQQKLADDTGQPQSVVTEPKVKTGHTAFISKADVPTVKPIT